MKIFYFFCALAMICVFPAKAQPFSSVVLGNVQEQAMICFTLARETNVKYYRIEASNDSIDYEIIGTVRAGGNSMLAKSYSYPVYKPAYKYYRIGMVGMDASLVYSSIVISQNGVMPTAPVIRKKTRVDDGTIVNNK